MGKRRSANRLAEQAGKGVRSYLQLRDHFTELATSVFEWIGLPSGIKGSYIERMLFHSGCVAFFEDETLGMLALKAMPSARLNVYDMPAGWTVRTGTGYYRELSESEAVPIYNGVLRKGSEHIADYYAQRLYDIDNAIDINIKAQKTPLMLTCDEDEKFSMIQLYEQYEGNAPIIMGTKKLNPQSLKAISTQAPFVADRLYTIRQQILNEALSWIGIANANPVKRERLIVGEMESSHGLTLGSQDDRLNTRLEACKEINERFGTNIICRVRHPISDGENNAGNPWLQSQPSLESEVTA